MRYLGQPGWAGPVSVLYDSMALTISHHQLFLFVAEFINSDEKPLNFEFNCFSFHSWNLICWIFPTFSASFRFNTPHKCNMLYLKVPAHFSLLCSYMFPSIHISARLAVFHKHLPSQEVKHHHHLCHSVSGSLTCCRYLFSQPLFSAT